MIIDDPRPLDYHLAVARRRWNGRHRAGIARSNRCGTGIWPGAQIALDQMHSFMGKEIGAGLRPQQIASLVGAIGTGWQYFQRVLSSTLAVSWSSFCEIKAHNPE